jgi:hypothetical protein
MPPSIGDPAARAVFHISRIFGPPAMKRILGRRRDMHIAPRKRQLLVAFS